MNIPLHILDGKVLNPNPSTVSGTRDLVNMFYALKNWKVSRKLESNNNITPSSPKIFNFSNKNIIFPDEQ